jgi:hypothetical protein
MMMLVDVGGSAKEEIEDIYCLTVGCNKKHEK